MVDFLLDALVEGGLGATAESAGVVAGRAGAFEKMIAVDSCCSMMGLGTRGKEESVSSDCLDVAADFDSAIAAAVAVDSLSRDPATDIN